MSYNAAIIDNSVATAATRRGDRSSGQVGHDIRALRQGRGWTLAELAGEINRSVGWLSQVERGASEPNLSDIRQIAALFNLPVSFFF